MKREDNKKTCFARPAPFARRLSVMAGGLTVQGLGLAVLRSIDLGVDPCSVLTQGVVNLFHLSFGTTQLLCQAVLFLFVLRFDISYIGFGTVGNMVFLGYISDFFKWLFALTLPDAFFASAYVRYALLLPGLALLLLGAGAYMCSGLGSSPYDAIPFIVSDRVKRLPFRYARMLWDTACMAAGFLLGSPVGIVTLAVAFFCGPVVSWVRVRLERHLLTDAAISTK